MSTDIFEAIKSHNLNRIVDVLSRGADSNALSPDWPRWTPLHEAIEQLEDGGSLEVLVLLLRHGASVNVWDAEHDATPLLMALFREQAEAIHLLLAVGAETNVVGSEGDSPLRWCVEHGDYDTAAMLLRCGATKMINSAGGLRGMTALGLAANQLDLRMIELLLQTGADPQALDSDKFTAYRRLPARSDTKDDAAWLAAEMLLVSQCGDV